MNTQKTKPLFLLSLSLLTASICFFISCAFEYELSILISGLLSFFCGIFLIVITFGDKNRNVFYISYKHSFFLKGEDLFSHSKKIKTHKIITCNNDLKDKLLNLSYDVYRSNQLKYKVYELEDNYQLLVFSYKALIKSNSFPDYYDYKINEQIIEKVQGIKDFNEEEYLEKYVSNDKKIIYLIMNKNNSFFVKEYIYNVDYCTNSKEVFMKMFPHWMVNTDGLNFIFSSLVEARAHIQDCLNYHNSSDCNDSILMKYFIFPTKRKRTMYHEFQTGNKDNLNWDQNSLLMSDNVMEETGFGLFLKKTIPNYDYYGITIVNKDSWNELVEKSKEESLEIKEIVQELSDWANKNFSFYSCFTIKGI